jgi:hypothetical protein
MVLSDENLLIRSSSSLFHSPILMTTLKVGNVILINLSRLISNIGEKRLKFSIDRSSEKCRTPRRNSEVYACLAYFQVC